MMQDKGKVELTWSNKNRRLVTLDEPDERGLLYRWVPPTDYRVAETRLLRQVGQVGTPPKIGNYLIRGDALHGLAALTSSGAGAQDLSGKVRLAYLDPPSTQVRPSAPTRTTWRGPSG